MDEDTHVPSSPDSPAAPAPHAPAPTSAPDNLMHASSRERLRFAHFQFGRTADGRCNATVGLDWVNGVQVSGKSSGQSSEVGDLRVAAEATLRALEAFSEGVFAFDLIGVKSLRVFDASVIIVSIAAKRGPSPSRLLGSCLVETDPIRGASLAVLNATNRVLGNFIATR